VTARGRLFLILAAAIILAGTFLRVAWMRHSALWCDEAESSINALTILDRGFPFNEYLGIPIYENTLTEPWDGHPEYEFRDSSYSPQGLAVYHGWLPLYAIAASQAICGLRPDHSADPPAVQHGVEQISRRTIAPRLPSIAFAVLCMASIYFLAGELGGVAAGFAALTLMAFNAKTVDFGYEARYYSLTLLATVLVAWCLLRGPMARLPPPGDLGGGALPHPSAVGGRHGRDGGGARPARPPAKVLVFQRSGRCRAVIRPDFSLDPGLGVSRHRLERPQGLSPI
jgi:hypothetical protein